MKKIFKVVEESDEFSLFRRKPDIIHGESECFDEILKILKQCVSNDDSVDDYEFDDIDDIIPSDLPRKIGNFRVLYTEISSISYEELMGL